MDAIDPLNSPGCPAPSPSREEAEVVAFLRGRSALCPRCAYELRDAPTATCPECGEPLILTIGTPRTRFGWLILTMAPGCFSGIAAVFVLVPIVGSIWESYPGPPHIPLPILGVDAFGFLSAASVLLLYRRRHEWMCWSRRRQILAAAAVWSVHVVALIMFITAMVLSL